MGNAATRVWRTLAGCLWVLCLTATALPAQTLAELGARFDAGDYAGVLSGAKSALEAGGRLACDDAAIHGIAGLAHHRLGRSGLADEAWCRALKRCPVWQPGARFTGPELALVNALRPRCQSSDFERANPPPPPLPGTLAGRWHVGASFGLTLPAGSMSDTRHYAANDGETNAIPVDAGPLGGVSQGIQFGAFAERFVSGRWAVGGSAYLHLLGQDDKSWFEEEFIQVSHRLWQIGAHGRLLLLEGPWTPYVKGGIGVTIEHYAITALDFPSADMPYDVSRTRTNPGLTLGAGFLALVSPRTGLEAEVTTTVLLDRERIGGPPDGLYELDDQDQTFTQDEITRSTRFVSLRVAVTVPLGG